MGSLLRVSVCNFATLLSNRILVVFGSDDARHGRSRIARDGRDRGTRAEAAHQRNMLLQMRDRERTAKYGARICEAAACRGDAIPNRGSIEATRWQHAVFLDPERLDEGEIDANEKYLALLRPEIRAYNHRLRAENAEEGELYSIERQHKLNLLKIHDFIDRVKQNQLVTKRKLVAKEKAKTLASIIQEQPLPLFPGTLDLSGLGQLFAQRRRLRPQAAKRPTPSALAEWPNCCDLYIQVQKAVNVPVRMKQRGSATASQQKDTTTERKVKQRSDKERAGGPDDELEDKDRKITNRVQSLRHSPECESQIFVEQQQLKSRVDGDARSAVSPPLDDLSPESIQQCQDEIRINLFDQGVVPSEDDDDRLEAMADRNATGAQLRSLCQENCFLGRLHRNWDSEELS